LSARRSIEHGTPALDLHVQLAHLLDDVSGEIHRESGFGRVHLLIVLQATRSTNERNASVSMYMRFNFNCTSCCSNRALPA